MIGLWNGERIKAHHQSNTSILFAGGCAYDSIKNDCSCAILSNRNKDQFDKKKAQLYVGYTKGQHINGWSITLFQDLFNNSKSSMQ